MRKNPKPVMTSIMSVFEFGLARLSKWDHAIKTVQVGHSWMVNISLFFHLKINSILTVCVNTVKLPMNTAWTPKAKNIFKLESEPCFEQL